MIIHFLPLIQWLITYGLIALILDCVRQKFKEYVTNIHKNDYSECNLPWTINLLNGQTQFGTKTCNLKSIFKQSSLNMKFFNKASRYEIPGCKGNAEF